MGLGAFVKRLFSGTARDLAAARQAELRGDLANAAALFGRADALEDAARVMLLRADAEPDPRARLVFLVQAASTAPAESALRKDARIRRAKTAIALAKESVLSAAIRMDLTAAAKELEELGEPGEAAETYRACGDREGEARALASAGKIDELEALLDRDQSEQRVSLATRERTEKIEEALATGQRRAALELLDAVLKSDPADRGASERADSLRGKRARGPILTLEIRGKRSQIVLGDEIVIGRTEGQIQIASHAVSRRHLRIGRRSDGVFVSDLGSRNGVTLRGLTIADAIAVGDGIEIALGNEVPVTIARCDDLDGAVSIEIGGARYVAPLGPARLGIGDWEIAAAADQWAELRFATTPAFIGNVSLVSPTSLLARDAIGCDRGASPVLEIIAGSQG